jgi:hypothetical protein
LIQVAATLLRSDIGRREQLTTKSSNLAMRQNASVRGGKLPSIYWHSLLAGPQTGVKEIRHKKALIFH